MTKIFVHTGEPHAEPEELTEMHISHLGEKYVFIEGVTKHGYRFPLIAYLKQER